MARQPTVTPTSDSALVRSSLRPPVILLSLVSLALTGCGTLTGLPAHGGGKRFATEQRLVSASIRSALMDIDVTPLKGKRAALIFDLVADEGGGSFNGGRWSPGLLFSVGSMTSPVTTTTNAFQVYNLAEAGTNYSNSSSGGGGTSVSTTLQSGTNTGTGSSNTDGSSTSTGSGSSTNTSSSNGTNSNTTNGSSTGTSTTNGSGTNNSSTTNTGTSSGNSTSTTGGTTTNTNFNQADNSTNTTTGSGTNTSTTNNSGTNSSTSNGSSASTTTGSGTSTNSGSGTNTSATNSTNNSTGNSQSTTTTTSSNSGTNRNSGGHNSQRQEVTPSPTESTTRTEGTKREHTATLAYRGLGDYQNFPVPKSDASLLMGLVRTYMLLNGVTPTAPNDPNAEVLVYVTVDIFGTVRSRFDVLLYNNETVKAETSFEIMAFDRDGKNLLMRPQVSNREAQYQEHYLLWAGPISTKERVYQGQGLLVDFTKVDGSKRAYNPSEPVVREHLGGKN